jgi:hypothetical protein
MSTDAVTPLRVWTDTTTLYTHILEGHVTQEAAGGLIHSPSAVRTLRPGSADWAKNVRKLLSVCGAKPTSFSSGFGSALTASSTRGESGAQEAEGPSSDPHTLRYLEP